MKKLLFITCVLSAFLIICYILVGAFNNCIAQQNKINLVQFHRIDSLENLLQTAKKDTNKVNILNQLCLKYISINREKAFEYGRQGLFLAEQLKFKKGIAESLNTIGVVYLRQSKYEKALTYYQKSLILSKKSGSKRLMARSLNNIADVYYFQGNYEKAIDYYLYSLRIFKELKDKNWIAEMLNNIGEVHRCLGNYQKALKYSLESLKISEELRDKQRIAASLNNIAIIYYRQGNYDKTINYFQQCLEILEELKSKQGIAAILGNMGVIYNNQGEYKKAMEYHLKCLKLLEELNDKQGIANALTNIGSVYREQGYYDKAIEYSIKSLKIREEIGEKKGIAVSLHAIAVIYMIQSNYLKAIEYNKESLSIAKQIGVKEIIKQIYESLAETYRRMSESHLSSLKKGEYYQKAYEYLQLYSEIKDSLFTEESSRQIAEMQEKYESEKKKKEIELLNKDKKLQAAELKKNRIMLFTFAGGFALVVIFSFLLYNRYRFIRKQKLIIEKQKEVVEKANVEITSQKDVIEQKNKDITDSIHYAQLIQEAILPTEKDLTGLINLLGLGGHFILFKPKDIVSGDFYWATVKKSVIARSEATKQSVGNNPQGKKIASPDTLCRDRNDVDLLIFAAVDCTGHGVPGAFMSMIGNTLLNEIVNEKQITKPSEILNELRKGVIDSLKQKGEEGEQQDGMDIALIVIDTETNKLQFSGANNPLYIIRKGADSSEIKADLSAVTEGANNEKHILYEVKADKMPISYYESKDKPFTNHKIQLQKGDTIYIFSDGFRDQFGETESKKFTTKRFKHLLLSIQDKLMNEQKEILDRTFMEWKGNLEQVDDILVMGIRI